MLLLLPLLPHLSFTKRRKSATEFFASLALPGAAPEIE